MIRPRHDTSAGWARDDPLAALVQSNLRRRRRRCGLEVLKMTPGRTQDTGPKRSKDRGRISGIGLATLSAMENISAVSRVATAPAEWLHWLFRQGDRVISCSYDPRRDGTVAVTLVPVWSPNDQTVETFLRSSAAVEWLEGMTRQLQAAGWRLVEAGVVTHAA